MEFSGTRTGLTSSMGITIICSPVEFDHVLARHHVLLLDVKLYIPFIRSCYQTSILVLFSKEQLINDSLRSKASKVSFRTSEGAGGEIHSVD